MKLAPIVVALAFAVTLQPVSAAQTQVVVVPGGTHVPIRILGSVSSSTAKAGDTFQFQAADNVVEHGMIVIRSGAEGQGTIAQVDSAGGNGHSGALGLSFDYVYAVDGGKIRLSSNAQKEAEEDRKGASSTATIIGFATFGLGGLFGHNLAHGKNVVIDGSKTLSAFVDSNVRVRTDEQGQSQNDNFDH